MAYREIATMQIWDIVRRWHQGTSSRELSRIFEIDRNTIKKYIRSLTLRQITRETPLPPEAEVLKIILADKVLRQRKATVRDLLLPHLEEITTLVSRKENPLKPKTAFEVVTERHALLGRVSYTSFRRFYDLHQLAIEPIRGTCRFEVAPGEEIQIDYAKIGLLFDPNENRKRTVFVFIGTLAHSRLKFVELTFKQDQMHFVGSHVRMFAFFGGVPSRVTIDNLKNGVIKPDLYDPVLNRSYAEMAEYYGCFIDPARVGSPQDKGKVERDVQTVRQAVRKAIELNPGAPIGELNRMMRHWSTEVYGMKLHGTTREKPHEVFLAHERPALKALPDSSWEIPLWHQVSVHPDHYIQCRKKVFSMPHAYLGKKLWIRSTEHILHAYYDHQIIKTWLITKAYRHTDPADFPLNFQAVMRDSHTHRKLLERADAVGEHFSLMTHRLLETHAYIHLRTVQGLVEAAYAVNDLPLVEDAICRMERDRVKIKPANLRHVIDRLRQERSTPQQIPLSEQSRDFLRDVSYFINHNTKEERS